MRDMEYVGRPFSGVDRPLAEQLKDRFPTGFCSLIGGRLDPMIEENGGMECRSIHFDKFDGIVQIFEGMPIWRVKGNPVWHVRSKFRSRSLKCMVTCR